MNEVKPLSTIKVLYVEDDDNARDALAAILKRRVGRLFTARDGKEGLELYEAHKPSIIVADLFMPNMGGVEMIRSIRQGGGKPQVIITTAVSDTSVILNAVDAGIAKYVVKPIEIPSLLEALTELAEDVVKDEIHGASALPENILSRKKELEVGIKKDFSAFMKASTGKGPLDVKVLISGTSVEVTAIGILTQFEKVLLDNYQNIVIIEQNRQLFFSIKSGEMKRMIADRLNIPVEVAEIIIDIKRDLNKLVFRWKG